MHEQVFLELISKHEKEGKSLDRILRDPVFKDIPLPERVELLKKYGHVIRGGSKLDSQYWKDLAWGSTGMAIAAVLAGPKAYSAFTHAIDLGEAAASGTPYSGPKPNLSISPMSMFAATSGATFGYKGLSDARKQHAARKLVKSHLRSEEGTTSTDDAIHVIARS